jgi:hypothetical protein
MRSVRRCTSALRFAICSSGDGSGGAGPGQPSGKSAFLAPRTIVVASGAPTCLSSVYGMNLCGVRQGCLSGASRC